MAKKETEEGVKFYRDVTSKDLLENKYKDAKKTVLNIFPKLMKQNMFGTLYMMTLEEQNSLLNQIRLRTWYTLWKD